MRRNSTARLPLVVAALLCLAAPVRAQSATTAAGGAAAKPAPTRLQARVWVNAKSGVYHCPGASAYGNTKSGEYMTQAEAKAAGKRAAGGRECK